MPGAEKAPSAPGERFFHIPGAKWDVFAPGTALPQHVARYFAVRAFLVNRAAITRVDVDFLYLGDIQLPISRKYKDAVAGIVQFPAEM